MPVTAKLSKECYDALGEGVANEFTDLLKWMVVLWTGTVLAVITTGILT